MVNCIRCNKNIPKASHLNAKYITNTTDVRTHGPIDIEVYQVMDETDSLVKEVADLNEANVEMEKKRGPMRAKIRKAFKDAEKLEGDVTKAADLVGKKAKHVELLAKVKEFEDEQEKLTKVRIKPVRKTMTIAKTGIICLDQGCQDANDQIIWGPDKTNK